MDLHQLKVFISVYKNRNFSKAAKEIFLTQPTISEHIKTLEEELKCTLFDRIGKKIIPTKEADILYEESLDLINKFENLKDTIQTIRELPSGNILIGTSSIPGTYILPSLITEFKNSYPEIYIQIDISDSERVINNLLSNNIFIGLVGTKINSSMIKYTPFMWDELVIASPNFIKKSTITPVELIKYPFIMRESGSGTRKETEKILKEIGIERGKLKIVCTLGSTDAVKQAIKNGLGLSILSIHSIRDEIECGKLKAIRIKGHEMKRMFYIVTNTKRTLPYIYKLFYEFLKKKALIL
ncbi:MAG: selenium metabolism-associated LysR family transcriptional regulator [Thermodesulfovibrio sp.]|nr:selenium metabolism-associated LysR family transcriptional regulator [Thermodesulfovibrio sp.]